MWSEDFVNKIICGDCIKEMKKMPDNSIDMILTDPPYGIGFMGKEWDKFNEIVNPQGAYEKKKGFKKLPRQSTKCMLEFFLPIWKGCLRILKPGAFAFVMAIPRQDVLARAIIGLEDAGFKIGFTSLYWAFASGFPKAGNISKMVDKRLGVERKVIGQKKRGSVEEAKKRGTTFTQAKANRTNKDIFGYGIEDITLPATSQAKSLDGSYAGFQPKPAVECILVAMKPLSEKTYVDQALKNRKGITWLDDCRIPYKQVEPNFRPNANKHEMQDTEGGIVKLDKTWDRNKFDPQGRFPANLVANGDVLNDGKIQKSGKAIRHNKGYIASQNIKFTQSRSDWKQDMGYGDSGSFHRYFNLDKWAVEKGVKDTFPFLIVPKASKSEKNRGLDGLEEKREQISMNKNYEGNNGSVRTKNLSNKNFHPTVKPIKLGCYLITLASREGDVMLDPFCGSGSFLISAKVTNRRYIGIDNVEEYCNISRKRLEAIKCQEKLKL